MSGAKSRSIRFMPDRGGRRRRPTGEPAALPRSPLAGSGKVWMALMAVLTALVAALMSSSTYFLASGPWWDDLDRVIFNRVVVVRSESLTNVAKAFDSLRSEWFLTALRWGTLIVLVSVKRWRHALVFVSTVLGAELLAAGLTYRMARARPDGIEILVDWVGFSFPSVPLVALTVTFIAMIYALFVPGLWRIYALRITSVLVTIVGLSRLYLGVDRFTDGLGGVLIAVTIPALAFRLFVPDVVYPVTYQRSKTAHLDLTGSRREAIFRALRDQLGLEATNLEPFGLEGSGGSTPLRKSLTLSIT